MKKLILLMLLLVLWCAPSRADTQVVGYQVRVDTNGLVFIVLPTTNTTLDGLVRWLDGFMATNSFLTASNSGYLFDGLYSNILGYIASNTATFVTTQMLSNALFNVSSAIPVMVRDVMTNSIVYRGRKVVSGSTICSNCGGATLPVIASTQVSKPTRFDLYSLLNGTWAAGKMQSVILYADTSSNGSVWVNHDVQASTIAWMGFTGAFVNVNVDTFANWASLHWFVESGGYYRVNALAESNLLASGSWTANWTIVESMP